MSKKCTCQAAARRASRFDAIREGRWDATLAFFPKTMGVLALDAIVTKLQGGDPPVVINMDLVGPMPAMITKKELDENPDFTGEWEQ